MNDAAKVISLIQRTPGYNDKQYLLKKNEDVHGLKEILKFIYNPYCKTGISTAKLYKALIVAAARGPYVMSDEFFVSYQDAIKYFKRHTTGTDADLVMAARFVNCTKAMFADNPFAAELARAIVTQDLQIGITAKTLNAVFGKTFIPMVGCMLGRKIEDVNIIKWPCIVTEKLDGVRRILIKENGVCRLYSRSGHEDTGLVDILTEAAYLPDNRVYDGELLAEGTFKDSVALRQATNALASPKGIKRGLSCNLFDMMPVEEFYAGKSDDNALSRKLLLGATLMDDSIQHLGFDDWPMYIASYGIHQDLQHIKSVPILGFVKNMVEVEPIVAEIWARGGEGVMLNTAEGYYEIKRSKDLLKVKHTKEYKLKVVDMMEGTGKYEDMLGALIVEYKVPRLKTGIKADDTLNSMYEYDVYKLGVGTGFTDAQRRAIWDAKVMYIGKYIEIDTFGESTNLQGTKSLNCPIFKRFAGEVE